ncbi:MAG: superoxide dismutase [Patescibacteria group bacterium]|mgnify:CR=1 FL=1
MYELPKLSYSYDALEPFLDAHTMEIHHSKHHATYVAKLNEALQNNPELQEKSVEELLMNLSAIPETIRTAVKNHGGGHANHSLFWKSIGPKKTDAPSDLIMASIEKDLGGFTKFKEDFSKMGVGVFGSGWAWLVVDASGNLKTMMTSNQESPLSVGLMPIMCLDVWEHAYYLKFQNCRADYIAKWWNVVDLDGTAERYASALAHFEEYKNKANS